MNNFETFNYETESESKTSFWNCGTICGYIICPIVIVICFFVSLILLIDVVPSDEDTNQLCCIYNDGNNCFLDFKTSDCLLQSTECIIDDDVCSQRDINNFEGGTLKCGGNPHTETCPHIIDVDATVGLFIFSIIFFISSIICCCVYYCTLLFKNCCNESNRIYMYQRFKISRP